MSRRTVTILWVRRDFRLSDNPALIAAVEEGIVIPLFIWDDSSSMAQDSGARSKSWLHHSLEHFSLSLGKLGSRLLVRRGTYMRVLREVILETGAQSVYWNRLLEPEEIALGGHVRETLEDAGFECKVFDSHYLVTPWQHFTKQGEPYKVFTPFWKAALQADFYYPPLAAPQKIKSPAFWPKSAPLKDLQLEQPDDADWIVEGGWNPGETGAFSNLSSFLDGQVQRYKQKRNRPDLDLTSMLSPHLHFGEITPRSVLFSLLHTMEAGHPAEFDEETGTFVAQLGWREFASYLLYHFPHTRTEPLRSEFQAMEWVNDPDAFDLVRMANTGYPIVDAGIRQLNATGWMHNRVRMIVASFLTKDLMIHWREGAAWFMEKLVDADCANNILGWQWTAGCGADAAPYFRIFNPVRQGESYDPDGIYVKRWLPELKDLPSNYIHHPWDAPDDLLKKAGVVLGSTYPERIIDHNEARIRALAAYDQIRISKPA
ncbi:DNA photolyase family protein [bacterium]|nr:DNA photolyase family protein [bacterium]